SLSATTSSFTLNWTKGSSTNTVVRRSLNTPPTNQEEGTLVYNNTGSSFTDSDPTLAKNTTYCYSIWSYNPSTAALSTSHISGCGTLSNMASPTNLTFPTVAYNSIILNWTPGTGSTKTYIVRKQGSIPANKDDGNLIYNDNGNVFIDTGLSDNTQYCYALYAEDDTKNPVEYTEAITGCQITSMLVGGAGSLLSVITAMDGTGNGDKTAVTQYASIPVEYVEISGDTTYTTTPTIGNSTADARMLVLRYKGNLTIDSGVSLTPQVRKRGMLLYVDGTLTVNGTISMAARGAANVAGDRILILTTGGTAYEVPAVGGSGGKPGSAGINGQTGGGGGGGSYSSTGGNGAAGTSYSGGTGGAADGGDGTANGGRGGDWVSNWGGCGGVGNPGGISNGGPNGPNGGHNYSGTGGLLIIYSRNVIIGSTGIINANGTSSYGSATSYWAGGGASGGGSVNIFYSGNLANNGTIEANGGAGGVARSSNGYSGGAGTVRVFRYDPIAISQLSRKRIIAINNSTSNTLTDY
ncbi:MAG: hypothetical protein PHW52_01530, partial [Candidatus Pacebacteria bacterium]|nr:hypothetical protein [Candidatus Paceibacterota bacterium]